jgi:hypothetical protein
VLDQDLVEAHHYYRYLVGWAVVSRMASTRRLDQTSSHEDGVAIAAYGETSHVNIDIIAQPTLHGGRHKGRQALEWIHSSLAFPLITYCTVD